MTITRQHLNNAALSVAKLLGMVTGMTDEQIDEIMDGDEARLLAGHAHSLRYYTEERKNARDTA